MWRRSPRRWTVMPSAPASSQMSAAAATLGSGARRACRTVATWSMLTLSRAVITFASNPLPGEFGRDVGFDLRVAGEAAAVPDALGRLARARDRRVVEPARGVAPDHVQLGEALQPGLEADRAALDVVPADGVFEHPQVSPVRDEE